jgi:hypothetical protein
LARAAWCNSKIDRREFSRPPKPCLKTWKRPSHDVKDFKNLAEILINARCQMGISAHGAKGNAARTVRSAGCEPVFQIKNVKQALKNKRFQRI